MAISSQLFKGCQRSIASCLIGIFCYCSTGCDLYRVEIRYFSLVFGIFPRESLQQVQFSCQSHLDLFVLAVPSPGADCVLEQFHAHDGNILQVLHEVFQLRVLLYQATTNCRAGGNQLELCRNTFWRNLLIISAIVQIRLKDVFSKK